MDNNIINKDWHYRMFKNDKIIFSCVIQNNAGDTICKMLRDDAPDYDTQEKHAETICKAVNNYNALVAALERIKNIYDNVEDAAGVIAKETLNNLK